MAQHYEGPYWVAGDQHEHWRDDARRWGWTDDDSRERARDLDRGWYWSAEHGRHVAVADGSSTTDDVAAQLSAGTGGQELAAQFWLDAADLLNNIALADLRAVTTDLGVGEHSRGDLSPAQRAALEAAENRATAWLDASNQAAGIAEYGSEQAAETAHATDRRDFAEAEKVYRLLFDSDHYAEIQGDGQAEDSYIDHIWDAARTYVAMGHTAADLRPRVQAASWGDDEATETHSITTADNLVESLGRAWREAAEITYTELVIDYGNDGRPEDDRVLPAADAARRDAAIELIVRQTGLRAGFIRQEMREAAEAHARAPGTDADPDHFAAPDWDQLAQADEPGAAPGDSDAATALYDDEVTASNADQVGSGCGAQDPATDGQLAVLLDELDQARARLEAGDVPAQREHEQVEYIEHLQEQVDAARRRDDAWWAAFAVGFGSDDYVASQPRGAGEEQTEHAAATATRPSADELITELVADLDSTRPDLDLGDVGRPTIGTPQTLRDAEDILNDAGPQSPQDRKAELADYDAFRDDDQAAAAGPRDPALTAERRGVVPGRGRFVHWEDQRCRQPAEPGAGETSVDDDARFAAWQDALTDAMYDSPQWEEALTKPNTANRERAADAQWAQQWLAARSAAGGDAGVELSGELAVDPVVEATGSSQQPGGGADVTVEGGVQDRGAVARGDLAWPVGVAGYVAEGEQRAAYLRELPAADGDGDAASAAHEQRLTAAAAARGSAPSEMAPGSAQRYPGDTRHTGGSGGHAGAAEAVAVAHEAVHADPHRGADEQPPPPQASARAAAQHSADHQDRPAAGFGSDGSGC